MLRVYFLVCELFLIIVVVSYSVVGGFVLYRVILALQYFLLNNLYTTVPLGKCESGEGIVISSGFRSHFSSPLAGTCRIFSGFSFTLGRLSVSVTGTELWFTLGRLSVSVTGTELWLTLAGTYRILFVRASACEVCAYFFISCLSNISASSLMISFSLLPLRKPSCSFGLFSASPISSNAALMRSVDDIFGIFYFVGSGLVASETLVAPVFVTLIW